MSDPLIIQTLKQKRAEISGVIAAYQARIAQARHDLAHINAVIRLVEGGEQERAQYIVSHGFFKKGEIADICLRHLKADGELDTRQLAERVMCERKLEVSDTPLRNSSSSKLFSLCAMPSGAGLSMVEKRKGICVWSAASGLTLRVANSRSRSR